MAAAAAFGGILRLHGATPARTAKKARVLVVGGGFAGATCALHLRRMDPAIEVTLVDPDDQYTTCPMSNSVLTGLRDLASITVSRRGLERAGVHYVRDRVVGVDAHLHRARVGGGAALNYDRLVMAPGIRFLWGTPQGYDEAAAQRMPHAWIAGAQTEILAGQLHRMRSGGVVAISVPAGPMRCPPGPFERASLIAAFLKRHKRRCKVLIFDANNHFPKQDVFTEAWETLFPGMIQWIPVVEDGAVLRVDPDKMILYTSRQAHRADVVNVIPPQAPALLTVEAGLASAHGWCPVNPQTFESLLVSHVHVIGDACIADPMPKSGSAANAQGKHCAAAIAAALDGRDLPQRPLESVCYSLLAPGRALSIHGRFRSAAGAMQKMPEPDDTTASAAQEAQNAQAWYQGIVADSFG
ncbi:MAG: FCSD flavin-binding domain-containing protein [Steroidobacteraceae bacterium]